MTRQQRIDALKKTLAAVEAALAQTNMALRMASDPNDILQLTSQLADLKAERQKLQFQLANLEGAGDELAALSQETSARVRALENDMNKAILDRTTVTAAINATSAVLAKVVEMRKAVA
jgi:predicted  nucleic acid-binding Zn-ribbon protein